MNQIIGALWKREKDGMDYFSGVLNDFRGPINIAVFPNNRKEADNQPDMNIVISGSNSDEKKKNGKETSKPKRKSTRQNKKTDPFLISNINRGIFYSFILVHNQFNISCIE